MKTFLSAFLTGLCVVHQVAAEPGRIEGAFGKKLGAVFEAGETPNEFAENNPGNQYQRYRFTPVAPFKGLTEYFVEVTPTTHRIYAIEAVGYAAEESEARRLTLLLGMILPEKYVSDPLTSEEINSSGRNQVRYPGVFIDGQRIEQRDPARAVEVRGVGESGYAPPPAVPRGPAPSIPRAIRLIPPATPNADPPAVPKRNFSVKLRYTDQKISTKCDRERAIIKQALDDEYAAKYAAEQKKKAEEEVRVRAEAEAERLKELAAIKEEAAKADRSGL